MYKPRAIGYSQHSPCDYGDPVENRRGDSNSRNRYQQSDMPRSEERRVGTECM